jgi:glucosamine--fructose-6-phosphate aminotransferase (isomerizing)
MNVPTSTPHVVEGPYLRDLLDQPGALQAAIDGLAEAPSFMEISRQLHAGIYRRIVLTGMGTSLFALYPLHLALSRRDLGSHWIETAELLLGFDGLYRRDTLLIAVSQSGESAEIVHLMPRARKFGHTIGVTNNPSSSLGRHAGTVLELHSGVESTVSCKSYLNTLAVLHWLRAALCQEKPATALRELHSAQRAVRRYLTRWREHVTDWLALTHGIEGVFITGRAGSLATAAAGGLILKESTRHHAQGMSCAAFRHGPIEMADDAALILVYAGDPRIRAPNRRLFQDVVRLGGRAVWASAGSAPGSASPNTLRLPRTCAALAPLVEILPVQMLSLALAARDGREAGRFERASKITTIA